MAGRGSVKVLRSRFVAAVSKTPRRTWQLNYKRRSNESCVSILGEVRGELREPGAHISYDARKPLWYIGRTLTHLRAEDSVPARCCPSRRDFAPHDRLAGINRSNPWHPQISGMG